jgi:hypothetical protein
MEGIPDTERISALAVANNYVYLGGGGCLLHEHECQSYLGPIDISIPTAMIEKDWYQLGWTTGGPARPHEMAAMGNYVYVADDIFGFQVLNVSDPTAIYTVTTLLDIDATSVTLAGHYAYVGGEQQEGALERQRLIIVDIADPLHLVKIGSYDTQGSIWNIAVVGSYAYLAEAPSGPTGGGLRVLDLSDPTAPAAVGFYDSPGEALAVAVDGPYAYLADGNAGLQLTDISDPTTPTAIDTYDTPGRAASVAVMGKNIYLADGKNGLLLFTLIRPQSYLPFMGR